MIDHGLTVLECFISDFVSYGYSFNGFSLLLLIVQCSYIVVLLNWTLYNYNALNIRISGGEEPPTSAAQIFSCSYAAL